MSILAAAFPPASLAAAGGRHGLQATQAHVTHQIHQLHTIVLFVCLAISVMVFAVMFHSLVRHRRGRGPEARHFHPSIVVELTWTAIPLLIVAGAAYPAMRTVIGMKDTANAELTTEATGHERDR